MPKVIRYIAMAPRGGWERAALRLRKLGRIRTVDGVFHGHAGPAFEDKDLIRWDTNMEIRPENEERFVKELEKLKEQGVIEGHWRTSRT